MFDQLIPTIETFIRTHEAWAGPMMGFFCFIECLFIVGMFTPATAILLSIGALIGLDILNFWEIFLMSLVGSLLGDMVSYYLGRFLNKSFLHHPYMKPYRSSIARSRLFFKKYGTYSLFIGRFIGPVRSIVPTIAGASRMPFYIFMGINFITAILWLLLYLLPGILGITLGKELISKLDLSSIEIFWVSLIAIILFAIAYLIYKKIRQKQKEHELNRIARKAYIAEQRKIKRLQELSQSSSGEQHESTNSYS